METKAENKVKNRICAICGEVIEGKMTGDHFFPQAIYKWTGKYKKKILNDERNKVFICEKCNYLKQEKILSIDELKGISDSKRIALKNLQNEIQDGIDKYIETKKLIRDRQNCICYVCKETSINELDEFCLRRIKKFDKNGKEIKRSLNNCKAVCRVCNAKTDKKEDYYK